MKQQMRTSLCLTIIIVFVASMAPTRMLPVAHAAPAPSWLQFTSGGHILGFTSNGMYAAAGSHALHVDFVSANNVQPREDAARASSAPGETAPFSRVRYANLWDGISLVYNAGNIYTTTYTLAPGADVKNIRLRYNAPLSLNPNGGLDIAFASGNLSESAPLAWQEIDGKRVAVAVSFQLREQEAGFTLGAYDPHYSLMIDPTLRWNTFLGGSGWDQGNAIAVDDNENVYVTGYSAGDWGTPRRAHDATWDVFVAKLDPAGNLLWNTFLGGSGDDQGESIAVDGNGNVVVVGYSSATWGDPLQAHGTAIHTSDAFVAKLDSSGNLTWNTFVGGSGGDGGYSVAVDNDGNLYLTGFSETTWGSPLRAYDTKDDAFVAKLDTAGSLIWNTFLGGSGIDFGWAIAVDDNRNVYVTGTSDATWGNPLRAHDSGEDAFAAKLDSSGNLTWNTFLGGNDVDEGWSIAVDNSGNVYVAGDGQATWGNPLRAYTEGPVPGWDAFVAKLDSAGNLTWNTFLGGSGTDYVKDGMVVESSGKVYVVGGSETTWGSPLQAYAAGSDIFLAELTPSGELTWNTFLGGNDFDRGNSIAQAGNGNLYITGFGGATWGNPLRAPAGSYDAFVALISTAPTVVSFSAPALSASLNIPITAFTATDDAGVTGYLITQSATRPSAAAPGWSGAAPAAYRVGSDGVYTLYPWAKDAAGNVSPVFAPPARVTVDSTPPRVNTFSTPALSASLAIPIRAFTATDDVGVTGYLITQSATRPIAGAAGWSGAAPATYHVSSDGVYTLYPWAKDAAGNVSPVFAPPAHVTVDTTAPKVTINQAAGQIDPTKLSPVNFTVIFSETVKGFGSADVKLGGSAKATTAIVTGSGATYHVAVSGMSASGMVIASIPAGGSQDAAGNGNAASTSADNSVAFISNLPPVISEGDSKTVKMSENISPTPFALTLHASDADHDALTWNILKSAGFGAASVVSGTGMVSYDPSPNYNGQDVFVVQVADGRGGIDSLTVHVTIQPRPYTGSLLHNQSYDIQYDSWIGMRSASALGGGYRHATAGNFTFKPVTAFRRIQWITSRGPDQGKAQVFVDGVLKASVDLYSATAQWRYTVEIKGLTNTQHTVVIKALNAKNTRSSGKWVVVDGFTIGAASYDDNLINTSVFTLTYGAWVGLQQPASLYGAYRISSRKNAIAAFSFFGVTFDWISARGPAYGKAAVYVDGRLVKTVDLYSPKQQWQSKVTISGLSYGSHAVLIKVLGAKNPAATGAGVVIDGFVIN